MLRPLCDEQQPINRGRADPRSPGKNVARNRQEARTNGEALEKAEEKGTDLPQEVGAGQADVRAITKVGVEEGDEQMPVNVEINACMQVRKIRYLYETALRLY